MNLFGWASRLMNIGRTEPVQVQTRRISVNGRTLAGVYMNPDEALKNATVWACVRYLSRTVAQLPWRVGVGASDGGFTPAPTHPLDWLLYKRPCPDMGSFAWREAMLSTALRWGNAFAEIQWDNRGIPYALWPIHPERVTVRRGDAGLLEYDVRNSRNGMVTLKAADIFHVRGFGEGPLGYNVIEYAAQSIGWARATELFGAAFFGQGMNPSGIVSMEVGLSPEAQQELRAELKHLYEGPRGERTAILDKGMKFEKLATNPNDGQFIETRQHQVEEICRWFGVPPHKVMHMLRAAGVTNLEQQSTEVVIDSIVPLCKVLEEEADYKLFGPANRQNFTTKINVKGLLRGDSAARATYYRQLWAVGGMTVNDILRAEDEPTIGREGDQRFVPMNVTTLERAIAGTDARPGAGAGGADPTAPGGDPGESLDPAPPTNGGLNGTHFAH